MASRQQDTEGGCCGCSLILIVITAYALYKPATDLYEYFRSWPSSVWLPILAVVGLVSVFIGTAIAAGSGLSVQTFVEAKRRTDEYRNRQKEADERRRQAQQAQVKREQERARRAKQEELEREQERARRAKQEEFERERAKKAEQAEQKRRKEQEVRRKEEVDRQLEKKREERLRQERKQREKRKEETRIRANARRRQRYKQQKAERERLQSQRKEQQARINELFQRAEVMDQANYTDGHEFLRLKGGLVKEWTLASSLGDTELKEELERTIVELEDKYREERERRARKQAEEEKRQQDEERQARINELLQRNRVMDHVHYMNGHEFERFMADLFRKQGYSVKHTPGSGDQGVDLLVDVEGRKVAVQLKRWTQPVGNAAVHATFAGMVIHKAQEAWLVTTSSFTKSAKEAARKTGVRLVDGHELTAWMISLGEEQ